MTGLLDWIKEKLGYERCSVCGHYKKIKYICYVTLKSMTCETICGECQIPKGRRVYKWSHDRLIPVNSKSIEFELERAGQPGALLEG